MRILTFFVALFVASTAHAQVPSSGPIVQGHVLPGYRALSTTAADLEQAAAADCSPESPELRAAYGAAFDAWVGVSHLRFGPSEVDDRAFALAFWPDPRGSTPKALGRADPCQGSDHRNGPGVQIRVYRGARILCVGIPAL